MRTFFGAVVTCIGFAVIGGAIWFEAGHPLPAGWNAKLGLGSDSPATEHKTPLTVSVVDAARRKVPLSFEYTGTIVSPADAMLQARVTGVVVARPFQPGNAVKKGQVLFEIDKRPFEVALKSAEAQKTQAQANLSFAQAQVERAKTLQKKGYETEQRLQKLASDLATAKADLQKAEAAIAQDTLNIDYATVRAPFDGRASLSNVNVGDLVTANQTELASVVQIDPIDVQVALSSDDAQAVHAAMAADDASIDVLDASGKPICKARIYKLDNRFDPRTDRRLVQALLNNADGHFLPGQFVRTQVRVGSEDRILIPTIALSSQLDQQIVYTVNKQGTVAILPVETGREFGPDTAVVKGVEAGTPIITDHLQQLDPGLKVEVGAGGSAAQAAPTLKEVER